MGGQDWTQVKVKTETLREVQAELAAKSPLGHLSDAEPCGPD